MSDLVMSLSAIHKRGGRRWAYKRTLNGAEYDTDAVRKLTINSGGEGYAVNDTLSGTGGGGSGFAGRVTKVGTVGQKSGVIQEVEITNNGTGYTSAPTITVNSQSGQNASIVASLKDVWHDGVHRKMSEISFKQPLETDELEDGTETPADYGKFEGNIQLQSAQDDANLIKFLMNEVQGCEFSVFIERGLGNDNKVIEFYFPICQISREYNSKSGDRKPTFNIKFTINDVAIIPSDVPSWAKGSAETFVVGIGEGFAVVES